MKYRHKIVCTKYAVKMYFDVNSIQYNSKDYEYDDITFNDLNSFKTYIMNCRKYKKFVDNFVKKMEIEKQFI